MCRRAHFRRCARDRRDFVAHRDAVMGNRLLLKASAIAATAEEIKRHGINPKGVRHSRSLGDLVGLMNSGVRSLCPC